MYYSHVGRIVDEGGTQEVKKLYRSTENRMIAGVAGGVAEYFSVDPVLIRLLWVLSIFIGGSGLLVYILAWLIIPEGMHPPDFNSSGEKDNQEQVYRNGGLILIALGIFFLARFLFPAVLFQLSWPLILIAIGLLLVFRGSQT